MFFIQNNFWYLVVNGGHGMIFSASAVLAILKPDILEISRSPLFYPLVLFCFVMGIYYLRIASALFFSKQETEQVTILKKNKKVGRFYIIDVKFPTTTLWMKKKEVVTFHVNEKIWNSIAVGDKGSISFQYIRFLAFIKT